MKHNTPAQRIAHAMVQARRANFIPTAHVARLLNLDIETLKQYERGKADVPVYIIERLFILGYQMLHFRDLNHDYIQFSRVIFKYGAPPPMRKNLPDHKISRD